MAGHCQPTPPLETPGHSQASLAQSLMGTLLLSPESWCTQGFSVHSKSLFLQSYGSPVIKSHWPLKSNSLGVLTPFARSSGWQIWALELLQQCENFFGIIVLQFVGHLLGGSNVWLMSTSSKGIDATHLCTSPHSQSLPSGSFHKPLIIIHQRGDRMKTTITVN